MYVRKYFHDTHVEAEATAVQPLVCTVVYCTYCPVLREAMLYYAALCLRYMSTVGLLY